MEQLPIDISFSKLADWLVDRRKIPSDWRKKLAQIRIRISSAIPLLPKDADPSFLTLNSESVGYLEAKRIREVLMKTLPEERTVFGRLAGVAGEWDAIVRAYEKDFLYLGEAAQIMTQNVNYEIPLQKKQIAKLQQQLADLERRETELKRSAAASASRYQQACQELGISGKSIRSELRASVNTLPKVFTELGEILCGQKVDEALQLYQEFVSYAHTEHENEPSKTLETLRDVRNKPFEVQPIVGPDSGAVKGTQHDIDTCEEAAPGIQWDVNGSDNNEHAPGIQWDIDVSTEGAKEENEEDGAAIQWDIDLADSVEEAADSKQSDLATDAEIVWDIDVEGGDSDKVEEPSESACISVEEMTTDAVPQSNLLDMNYRNQLLNDLFEIKAFLGQRVQELENPGNATLQSQMQAVAPTALQQHGPQALREMEGDISRALNLLTNSRTRDLLLILTSKRFLDRLESSLQQKKQVEVKSLDGLKDVENKRVELRNALTSSWPKQEELISRTKQVKLSVEKALSQQYEGRPVNIIGEINTI